MCRVLCAVLCVVGLCSIVACSGGASTSSPAAKPTGGNEVDAKLAAEDSVKKYLKFPDDASFPFGSKSAEYDAAKDHWTVTGKVKAKNALGAELTHRFEAKVRIDGTKFWTLYVAIDGEVMHESEELRLQPIVAEPPKIEPDRKSATIGPEKTVNPLVSEKPKAPPAEVAAGKLRLIRKVLEKTGSKDTARKRLQELIDDYPGTEAAREAGELLKQLQAD